MTEQVCFFLVPAISPKLPLPTLLKVLVTMDKEKLQSVWMLYSLLSILEQNQGITILTFFDDTSLHFRRLQIVLLGGIHM